jgi:hypothetical protein
MSFETAHEISAQVERNIAKSFAGSPDEIPQENVTVHFEPTASSELPPESLIEIAAVRVSGVRGVHNILVSKIGGTNSVGVSLHVQVNRSATLTEAHGIANAVEDSIKRQLKGVDNITVHLEPLMPAVSGIEPVADGAMQGTIREIVMAAGEIKQVGRIATYRTGDNILKIDVDCVFEGAKTIEQIHELASDIADTGEIPRVDCHDTRRAELGSSQYCPKPLYQIRNFNGLFDKVFDLYRRHHLGELVFVYLKRGDKGDWHRRVLVLQAPVQLKAIHLGHPDVSKYEAVVVGLPACKRLKRILSVAENVY